MKIGFLLGIVTFCLSGSVNSQVDVNGIRWETNLSWGQIKEKAKNENKYIFIDVYATWCAPCKVMDKDVYPLEEVGDFMNEHFVSIKVQADSSAQDDQAIKMWYHEAAIIKSKYNVGFLPSYLFFSPAGNILHKGIGAIKKDEFLTMAKESLLPGTQYYSLLKQYNEGTLESDKLRELAIKAKSIGQMDDAKRLALDYKNNYLYKSADSVLFTRENISFIDQFFDILMADGSEGRYFKTLYRNGASFDSAIYTYSKRLVNAIIQKEEIDDKLWKDGKPIKRHPEWKKIERNISSKYSAAYVDELLLNAQIRFYRQVEDWKNCVGYVELKMKKYPPQNGGKKFGAPFGDAWTLNNNAWDVFLHCNDPKIIRKALDWSGLSISIESDAFTFVQFFDTKANLLYKLGRVKEAIAFEKKAVEIDMSNAKRAGWDKGPFTNEYTATINKMQKGLPTWKIK